MKQIAHFLKRRAAASVVPPLLPPELAPVFFRFLSINVLHYDFRGRVCGLTAAPLLVILEDFAPSAFGVEVPALEDLVPEAPFLRFVSYVCPFSSLFSASVAGEDSATSFRDLRGSVGDVGDPGSGPGLKLALGSSGATRLRFLDSVGDGVGDRSSSLGL